MNKTPHIVARAIAFASGGLLQDTQGPTFLHNPTAAAGINNVPSLVAASLKALVQISLPILTLFIVYAGFRFVIARGNPDRITEAKNNFFYVLIGSILIIGAWTLAIIIGATASQVIGA